MYIILQMSDAKMSDAKFTAEQPVSIGPSPGRPEEQPVSIGHSPGSLEEHPVSIGHSSGSLEEYPVSIGHSPGRPEDLLHLSHTAASLLVLLVPHKGQAVLHVLRPVETPQNTTGKLTHIHARLQVLLTVFNIHARLHVLLTVFNISTKLLHTALHKACRNGL